MTRATALAVRAAVLIVAVASICNVAALALVRGNIRSQHERLMQQQLLAQLGQAPPSQSQPHFNSQFDSQQYPGTPYASDSLISFMKSQQQQQASLEQQQTALLEADAMQSQSQSQSQSLSQSVSEDEGGEGGGGGKFGTCKTCVFVLERIKKGSNMLLPAICSEMFQKWPDAYPICHQVLNALSLNGNNVRYWLFEGCFKYEVYRAKEWIKPCPSHVMCSVLKDLKGKQFCAPLPMENPFKEGGGGAEGDASAE